MKPTAASLWLAFLAATSLPSKGEETPPPKSPEDSAAIIPPGSACVIGEIPDGTPPPPEVPRPRLQVAPEDVLSTRVTRSGGRDVIFQKIRPLVLPPPAPAAAPLERARRDEHPDDIKPSRMVFLGAQVFERAGESGSAVTRLQLWPTPQSGPISLWVNANFLWLTGFADFETDACRYSLLMAVSLDGANPRETAGMDRVPEFPDPDKASLVVTGGNPTAEQLAPIHALVALYNSPAREKLRLAYLGRQQAAADRERERREHPPQKKNLVIRYWRADQAATSPNPASR